jgi:nucleoside-diphosphate-sugar epimerase
MKIKTALITGGNGIIGRNLATYLTETDDWKVIITSQSSLTYDTTAEFVRLDLTKPEVVAQSSGWLRSVTHVFFASYIEKETLSGQTSANTLLLENLIKGIEPIATQLEHVTFIQGGKAYGAHLGKAATPAYETAKRHFPPNFYFNQEDFLRSQSQGKQWSWTALRPDGVIGLAIGNPMNLGTLIAVYASLCKELNVPMRFPGTDEAYNALFNVTDARLLAKGMEFVALSADARGEIYNITNGDIFRWKYIWPKLAAYFEIEVDEPQTFSLSVFMADKKPVWDAIIRKYQLTDYNFERLVQWPFGDFLFNAKHDLFMDVNKLRRIGFNEMHKDTYSSFTDLFDELKFNKIIPAWEKLPPKSEGSPDHSGDHF